MKKSVAVTQESIVIQIRELISVEKENTDKEVALWEFVDSIPTNRLVFKEVVTIQKEDDYLSESVVRYLINKIPVENLNYCELVQYEELMRDWSKYYCPALATDMLLSKFPDKLTIVQLRNFMEAYRQYTSIIEKTIALMYKSFAKELDLDDIIKCIGFILNRSEFQMYELDSGSLACSGSCFYSMEEIEAFVELGRMLPQNNISLEGLLHHSCLIGSGYYNDGVNHPYISELLWELAPKIPVEKLDLWFLMEFLKDVGWSTGISWYLAKYFLNKIPVEKLDLDILSGYQQFSKIRKHAVVEMANSLALKAQN